MQNRRRNDFRGLAYAATACLGAFVIVGCATDEPGISPPRDELYFPTGLALDYWRDSASGQKRFDRPLLIVTNSNADLRFNGGTINVVDLSKIPDDLAQVGAWIADGRLPGCARDRIDPSAWECRDQDLIDGAATVRIGDYPAAVYTNKAGRIYTPVRAQTSGSDALVWVEVVSLPDGKVDLRCNNARDTGCGGIGRQEDCSAWTCDDFHRVNASTIRDLDMPSEPYGIFLNQIPAVHVDDQGLHRSCKDGLADPPSCDCGDSTRCADDAAAVGCCIEPEDQIYVAHLRGGEVSLFVSPGQEGLVDAGQEVLLEDVRSGFFDVAGSTVGGGVGIAASVPGDALHPIYVTSRFDGDIASFVVNQGRIVRTEGLAIGAITPNDGGNYDLRGIAADRDGAELYVVSRVPPGLVGLQLSDNGQPTESSVYEPLWSTAVCADPSYVVLAPDVSRSSNPAARLAYVVCFADSQVFVVDAQLGAVLDIVQTGKGPNALVLDTGSEQDCSDATTCPRPDEACLGGRCIRRHPRAFVANFLDNTIGIIDLDPSSPSFRRTALTIGLRRRLVEE